MQPTFYICNYSVKVTESSYYEVRGNYKQFLLRPDFYMMLHHDAFRINSARMLKDWMEANPNTPIHFPTKPKITIDEKAFAFDDINNAQAFRKQMDACLLDPDFEIELVGKGIVAAKVLGFNGFTFTGTGRAKYRDFDWLKDPRPYDIALENTVEITNSKDYLLPYCPFHRFK